MLKYTQNYQGMRPVRAMKGRMLSGKELYSPPGRKRSGRHASGSAQVLCTACAIHLSLNSNIYSLHPYPQKLDSPLAFVLCQQVAI